jgi:hypothetical protein
MDVMTAVLNGMRDLFDGPQQEAKVTALYQRLRRVTEGKDLEVVRLAALALVADAAERIVASTKPILHERCDNVVSLNTRKLPSSGRN